MADKGIDWTDCGFDLLGIERWIRGVSRDGEYRFNVHHEAAHGYYTARIDKSVADQFIPFSVCIARYVAETLADARAWCDMMSDWLAEEVRHGQLTGPCPT